MDRMEFEKIIDWAIESEVEAEAFYREVSRYMNNPAVKELFERLAKEELGHKNTLERIKKDEAVIDQFTRPGADFKLAEITEEPELSIDLSPADAIALAMKKEQAAYEFYTKIAAQSADAQVHKVFSQLAAMELEHKHKMENAFVDIGYPEVW